MKTGIDELGILWMLSKLIVLYVQTIAATKTQSSPIIAGSFADLGQFPWHVLLKRNETDQLLCGGSIISNKWILTSARCLGGLKSIFMAFGTIHLNDSHINMTSKALFIYPTYSALDLVSDVGLIELPSTLDFTDNIQAIDLATSADADNSFQGAETFISGFGYYDDNSFQYSQQLLWAPESVVDNSVCVKSYGPMSDKLLCSIGKLWNAQRLCTGDFGGALVFRNEFNKFIQIGISSYTQYPCSQHPSVYTRLTSYLDYINNITGLNIK